MSTEQKAFLHISTLCSFGYDPHKLFEAVSGLTHNFYTDAYEGDLHLLRIHHFYMQIDEQDSVPLMLCCIVITNHMDLEERLQDIEVTFETIQTNETKISHQRIDIFMKEKDQPGPMAEALQAHEKIISTQTYLLGDLLAERLSKEERHRIHTSIYRHTLRKLQFLIRHGSKEDCYPLSSMHLSICYLIEQEE